MHIRGIEKVMRALDNGESAKKIIDGLKVYYNFIRPHQGLDGKTPAEVAGINLELKGNRWLELYAIMLNLQILLLLR